MGSDVGFSTAVEDLEEGGDFLDSGRRVVNFSAQGVDKPDNYR